MDERIGCGWGWGWVGTVGMAMTKDRHMGRAPSTQGRDSRKQETPALVACCSCRLLVR